MNLTSTNKKKTTNSNSNSNLFCCPPGNVILPTLWSLMSIQQKQQKKTKKQQHRAGQEIKFSLHPHKNKKKNEEHTNNINIKFFSSLVALLWLGGGGKGIVTTVQCTHIIYLNLICHSEKLEHFRDQWLCVCVWPEWITVKSYSDQVPCDDITQHIPNLFDSVYFYVHFFSGSNDSSSSSNSFCPLSCFGCHFHSHIVLHYLFSIQKSFDEIRRVGENDERNEREKNSQRYI